MATYIQGVQAGREAGDGSVLPMALIVEAVKHKPVQTVVTGEYALV
jgi:hypothetical protein